MRGMIKAVWNVPADAFVLPTLAGADATSTSWPLNLMEILKSVLKTSQTRVLESVKCVYALPTRVHTSATRVRGSATRVHAFPTRVQESPTRAHAPATHVGKSCTRVHTPATRVANSLQPFSAAYIRFCDFAATSARLSRTFSDPKPPFQATRTSVLSPAPLPSSVLSVCSVVKCLPSNG